MRKIGRNGFAVMHTRWLTGEIEMSHVMVTVNGYGSMAEPYRKENAPNATLADFLKEGKERFTNDARAINTKGRSFIH